MKTGLVCHASGSMVEETTFVSGALRLQARFEAVAGATGAAVVCHPHPLYGGSMDNNVVAALAAACREAGWATLCFNFRGVGDSEGGYGDVTGECDDARAAIESVRERVGDVPVVLAGYSFGAMVALRVGADQPAVTRVVAVAPPLAMGELSAPRHPTLVLAGDRDAYCPPAALQTFAATLSAGGAARTIAGADHFLAGHEAAITAAARDFLAGAVGR